MITVVSTSASGEVEIRNVTDDKLRFDPHHIDGSPCLLINGNPHWSGSHVVYQGGVEIWRVDLGIGTEKTAASIKSYWDRIGRATGISKDPTHIQRVKQ